MLRARKAPSSLFKKDLDAEESEISDLSLKLLLLLPTFLHRAFYIPIGISLAVFINVTNRSVNTMTLSLLRARMAFFDTSSGKF